MLVPTGTLTGLLEAMAGQRVPCHWLMPRHVGGPIVLGGQTIAQTTLHGLLHDANVRLAFRNISRPVRALPSG